MALSGTDIVGELYEPTGDHSSGPSRRNQFTPPLASNHSGGPSRTAIDLHVERKEIVLWKKPITTIHYFLAEIFALLGDLFVKLWWNKGRVFLSLIALALCITAYFLEGEHQSFVQPIEQKFLWCIYWVGLGVLSSIGLGTGLHTFLLYLGPHIAAVTLAATMCKSLDFPEPPYPDRITCPAEAAKDTPGILQIMSKVRLEAFMWGAGTALGELPPYFMARAARISGKMDEEEIEVLREFEALERTEITKLSLLDRAKLAVEKLIEKVGFFGILACASIPNPLFDVAGFMCGHFLVPFQTFFGATLIGKAVIKMHIQKMFVIFAFDEAHVKVLLNLAKSIPYVGERIEAPFADFLQKQKDKFHRRAEPSESSTSMLSYVFDKFVLIMVLYFVVSLVNSMAQGYHKRLSKRKTQ